MGQGANRFAHRSLYKETSICTPITNQLECGSSRIRAQEPYDNVINRALLNTHNLVGFEAPATKRKVDATGGSRPLFPGLVPTLAYPPAHQREESPCEPHLDTSVSAAR